MVASELRIGNIVKHKTEYMNDMYPKFYWKVTNIGVKSFKCKGFRGNNFEPIPLTEEILINAGFDLIGTSYFIKSLPCIYFSKPYVEANHLLVKSNIGDKLTSVMYLHQLQNLIFVLTGQELNVKL